MSNAFSREFLGETPKKGDQVLVFAITFIVMAIIGYKNYSDLSGMPIWKPILYLIMVLDIVAGAIANFTKSSQEYYKNNTQKRVTFLLMHFIHIGLLILAIGHLWYCLAVLIYTLIGSFIVNFTNKLKQQEINASVVVCLGVILFYVVFPAPQIIMWLPAILLVKLVFGFSIRRER